MIDILLLCFYIAVDFSYSEFMEQVQLISALNVYNRICLLQYPAQRLHEEPCNQCLWHGIKYKSYVDMEAGSLTAGHSDSIAG